jgi:hypothetical protein
MEHVAMNFEIVGLTPIMFHNGQLADPLNVFVKQLQEVTSKQKMTDADHLAKYELEWEGALYLDESRRPVIPGENIEAAMLEGAKKLRLGPKCKAGVLSDGDWPLTYKGPKDIDALRADARFRDVRRVGVNGRSVMRCRPIFFPWSLRFTLLYLPDVLSPKQVRAILETTGRIVGIGDFTPKYGRFRVA